MNYTLKGLLEINTEVIDPSLPRGCKKKWIATGDLIFSALRQAYFKSVEAKNLSSGEHTGVDEAYMVLAGRLPFVKQKRTQVGRNVLLTKHSQALSLFGSLSHNIKGKLRVGFIHKANHENLHAHDIHLINANPSDMSFLLSIMKHWSNDLAIGNKTDIGFGDFSAKWDIYIGENKVGVVRVSQGAFSYQRLAPDLVIFRNEDLPDTIKELSCKE